MYNKIVKYIILLIVIISLLFLFYNLIIKHNNKLDITEKSLININFEDASLNNRILLSEILNYNDEILITEDNIDNTLITINNANLLNGVYIERNSKETMQYLLDIVFGKECYIVNNEGYIQTSLPCNQNIDLYKQFNNYINSKNSILIISICDSYKCLLNDGSIVDFFIEQNDYSKIFRYNSNVNIALINSQNLNSEFEGLSEKEIFEEVFLSIISNLQLIK